MREEVFSFWYSELQELEKGENGRLQPEDEDQLFRTQISPYFSEVYYCYYGEEEMTVLMMKRNGQFSRYRRKCGKQGNLGSRIL